jgi:hypothetical protein
MSNRPKATVLSFSELGAAIRAKQVREGRPEEQAQPLPVHFPARDCFASAAEENERIKRNAERMADKPSDSE